MKFYSVAYITESGWDNGLNKTNAESPLKRPGWLDLDIWIAFRQILLLPYFLGSSVDDNVKTGKSLQEHLDKFSVIQSDSLRSLWQKHIENFIKTRVSSAVCFPCVFNAQWYYAFKWPKLNFKTKHLRPILENDVW